MQESELRRGSVSCGLLDLSQLLNYFFLECELCWKGGRITDFGQEESAWDENEQLVRRDGSDVWRLFYFGFRLRKHNSFWVCGVGSVWLTTTLAFGA